MQRFEYSVAADLQDALEKLQEQLPGAHVLAGGTDLVLAMKKKAVNPDKVLCLQNVRELDFVRRIESRIHIGALATFSTLAGHEIIKEHIPILAEAAGLIGSWQVRNVATIGGNLCSASPAADSAPVLLALDAQVVLANLSGETTLPLASFFLGPGETDLVPGQLLKEIIINIPTQPASGRYLKLMRRNAVDLALVGVAFQAELDETHSRLASVAIGLGGVAPTPIRAPEAEALLIGLLPSAAAEKLPEAAHKAVGATRPISDVRASAAYRRALVEAYVRRAGEQTLDALFQSEGEKV